ncbi:VOC family protein [Demetria terragena]|uniref:VOC family protein n=1 Tax=Demetria terragena TaxID=63959 RepID=UPI000371F123|nr:glyoxalase/bleomycin resistance/dioxygenase family protein [Demetria terragena]
MNIHSTFITRYVAEHQPAVDWYAALFGREPDASPVPNCREWYQPGGVIFQVILDPARSGSQSFAFAVDSLDAEVRRVADAGLAPGSGWAVQGFENLHFVPFSDPEGVEVGLLNKAE